MNTAHTAAGTYFPVTPGAKTLADMRDLHIDGERVSAVVDHEGGYSVFIGGKVVAYGQLNGTEGDLMVFFAAEAMIAGLEAKIEEVSVV